MNPGLEELVQELVQERAGSGVDNALAEVRATFLTSAIAVLARHGPTRRSLASGTAPPPDE